MGNRPAVLLCSPFVIIKRQAGDFKNPAFPAIRAFEFFSLRSAPRKTPTIKPFFPKARLCASTDIFQFFYGLRACPTQSTTPKTGLSMLVRRLGRQKFEEIHHPYCRAMGDFWPVALACRSGVGTDTRQWAIRETWKTGTASMAIAIWQVRQRPARHLLHRRAIW